jgi:hypothetical protein
MPHPLFYSDRETPDKVLMTICEDNECPVCTKSIKKMNEMRKDEYIESSKNGKEIIRLSFSIPPNDFFMGFQNFSGVEDIVYKIFQRLPQKHRKHIEKSNIILTTYVENSPYYTYPVLHLELWFSGKFLKEFERDLNNVGTSTLPLISGESGWAEKLDNFNLLNNVKSSIDRQYEFPELFIFSPYNPYGTQKLIEQLNYLSIINFHDISPDSVFDIVFSIPSFREFEKVNLNTSI